MRSTERLTEQGGWLLYLGMFALSGLALTLSMPWAATVRELITFPWKPSPLVFFAVLTLMAVMVGLNRGSTIAPRGPLQWRQVRRLLGHILFAHMLTVPYLIFARSLLPGHVVKIPILTGYSILVSLAFGLAAYLRQAKRWALGSEATGLNYVLAILVFALPLIAWLATGSHWQHIALLSPVGTISHFLGENTLPWSLIGIAIPLAAILFLMALLAIRMRRWAR